MEKEKSEDSTKIKSVEELPKSAQKNLTAVCN